MKTNGLRKTSRVAEIKGVCARNSRRKYGVYFTFLLCITLTIFFVCILSALACSMWCQKMITTPEAVLTLSFAVGSVLWKYMSFQSILFLALELI